MLLTLMATGYLPHWWQYVILAACFLIQLAGSAALAVIYVTRPPRKPWRCRRGRR